MAESSLDEPGLTRPRMLTVSTVLAWTAPMLFVVAALFATLPVDNPGVQKCDMPILSVLRATPDAPLFTEAGEPLNGWNQAQRTVAYKHRCSVRVADRMVPAGIAFTLFLVTGTSAVLLSWTARRSMRARRRAPVTTPTT